MWPGPALFHPFLCTKRGLSPQVGSNLVMACSTLLALLCSRREDVRIFYEVLRDAGVPAVSRGAGALDEQGRRHVVVIVERSNMEKFRLVIHPNRHCVVHEAMFKVCG